MTAEFDFTNGIVKTTSRCGEEFVVVEHTNRRVVVRCPSEQAAKRLSRQLAKDEGAWSVIKRGLRTEAWYLEAQ